MAYALDWPVSDGFDEPARDVGPQTPARSAASSVRRLDARSRQCSLPTLPLSWRTSAGTTAVQIGAEAVRVLLVSIRSPGSQRARASPRERAGVRRRSARHGRGEPRVCLTSTGAGEVMPPARPYVGIAMPMADPSTPKGNCRRCRTRALDRPTPSRYVMATPAVGTPARHAAGCCASRTPGRPLDPSGTITTPPAACCRGSRSRRR